MLDFVFTLATCICFSVALLYVTACSLLKGRSSVD